MDSIELLRIKDSQLLKQLIQTHLSFIIESNFDLNLIQQKTTKRKITNNGKSYH